MHSSFRSESQMRWQHHHIISELEGEIGIFKNSIIPIILQF